MSTEPLNIYLTKNHNLNTNNNASNVFVFNENGPLLTAKWIKKNIEQNDCNFVIIDHNSIILNETERELTKKGYYIENILFKGKNTSVSLNPFDFVKDMSEIHFMFLSFLYAVWDEKDEDLVAMSNLIDAFASCIFCMFSSQKEKMNMETMKKMVYSVRATCQENNKSELMSDAIFENIKDQNSMPCKYYKQFKSAAGDRKEEIAEKVAKVFDKFTEFDIKMMSKTDDSLVNSFSNQFKTALFLNITDDVSSRSAKILLTLLNYCLQRNNNDNNVMLIIDNLPAKNGLISLPQWLNDTTNKNVGYLIVSDDLAKFKSDKTAEEYFKNIQKTVSASLLIHKNEILIKYSKKMPITQTEINEFSNNECLATVLIPKNHINAQDVLF